MSPVTIWEQVNRYEPMMKTSSDLVPRKSLMDNPVLNIITQDFQVNGNSMPGNSNVFVAMPELVKSAE